MYPYEIVTQSALKRLAWAFGQPRRQRGSVVVMAILMLPVVIAFSGLALDIGRLFVVRAELQNAADAAAMAGAACLYPSPTCGNASAVAPDFSTAKSMAAAAISLNRSGGAVLTGSVADGSVEAGYWDLTGAKGLRGEGATPTANDVPVVRVKISKDSGKNGGPVALYFAPLVGLPSLPVAAMAAAAPSRSAAASAGGFPVAVSQCLFDTYWDAVNNRPKIDPATNAPYKFRIGSSYHYGACDAGQWTTYYDKNNSAQFVRDIIDNYPQGAPTLTVNTNIWVDTGTKTTLYGDIHACSQAGNGRCEFAVAAVLADISSGWQGITALSCIHILDAVGGSSKYVEVQLSNACRVPVSSGGTTYGLVTPPRVVQ